MGCNLNLNDQEHDNFWTAYTSFFNFWTFYASTKRSQGPTVQRIYRGCSPKIGQLMVPFWPTYGSSDNIEDVIVKKNHRGTIMRVYPEDFRIEETLTTQ